MIERSALALEKVLKEYKTEWYPVDVLMGDKKPLPEQIDPTKLETYLKPSDFTDIFEMTKEEWEAVQPWKKADIRRQKGFF